MQPIEVVFRPDSGYAVVVRLCGEHDLATSSDLAAALAPLSGRVLVDATACEFIDSTAIGVLIRKSQELTREGYALELTYGPGTAVARVFEIIDIASLLTVYPRSGEEPPPAANGDAEAVTA